MAAQPTSSLKQKKKARIRGEHKFWIKWTDGNARSYYSNPLQDKDKLKFRQFMDRLFLKRMWKVAIIHHYHHGELQRMYLSDQKAWLTPGEIEAQNALKNDHYNAPKRDQPAATGRPAESAPDHQPNGATA